MSEPQNPFQESDFQRMLDSMFVRENDELLEQLRERMAQEEERDQLAQATGIEDEQLLQQLLDLGITAHSIAALTIYPLVVVAYADGVLNIEERDLILKTAHEWNMKPGDAGYEVLKVWLEDGPSKQGFEIWQKYMSAVMAHMTPAQRSELKNSIMTRSRAVAESVGDVLGRFGNRTSTQEKARLAQIEAALQQAS